MVELTLPACLFHLLPSRYFLGFALLTSLPPSRHPSILGGVITTWVTGFVHGLLYEVSYRAAAISKVSSPSLSSADSAQTRQIVLLFHCSKRLGFDFRRYLE